MATPVRMPVGPVRVPYVQASGVPTSYADLPPDVLAAFIPGLLGRGKIQISQKHGLDPAVFQHELEHARQMGGSGLLQRLSMLPAYLLAKAQGKDPLFESFLEAPAYALQDRAKRRQDAETMARIQERYRQKKRKMIPPVSSP